MVTYLGYQGYPGNLLVSYLCNQGYQELSVESCEKGKLIGGGNW